MIAFDEGVLRNSLRQIPPRLQAAFAAACAQRLMPSYESFVAKLAPQFEDQSAVRTSLELLWCELLKDTASVEILGIAASRCLDLVPDEDEASDAGSPYAEDTVASVVFALRTYVTGDSQNAAWSARRAYEVMDNFVIANHYSADDHFDEILIVAHPLVQSELQRQRRDLELVKRVANDQLAWASAIESLRTVAMDEGQRMLSS